MVQNCILFPAYVGIWSDMPEEASPDRFAICNLEIGKLFNYSKGEGIVKFQSITISLKTRVYDEIDLAMEFSAICERFNTDPSPLMVTMLGIPEMEMEDLKEHLFSETLADTIVWRDTEDGDYTVHVAASTVPLKADEVMHLDRCFPINPTTPS